MTSTSRPAARAARAHRTGGASARSRGSAARRALRREIPSAAAVLADERDFSAMRRYRTFPFDDHSTYLEQMETLLHTLAGQGVLTTVSLFDPVAYEQFCADLALDPDRPESRARYTAEVARTGATLTYEDEPLSRLIPLLVEESDRQATWRHASGLLARAGSCEECGADLAHAAFARATQALQQLLAALGDGAHHLVCSIAAGHPSLLAAVHATTHEGAPRRLDESESLLFCTVLATGFALRAPGGIVSRTLALTTDSTDSTDPTHSVDRTDSPGRTDSTAAADEEPTAPADRADRGRDTVRGWSLRDSWLRPLSAAEVFTAYCTDTDTGEPIPPEHGVDHAPGLPLTPPPDPHTHH
ncbi:hypothetical protein SSP35_04_05220 [Streptomyces sp. NBRC 110611]|uniref:hypothetical protein n=1 Tax=Streptomyces sp. NBRC 110611 TaxID=1621259 RepID=UPI000856C0B2|nr:hypothetical protein [Streptomyces sp. NBRC 110611]GAU67431.1 hypothetical protein SSP35_04_05220 [Streptomyces sp. NBRC 110611]